MRHQPGSAYAIDTELTGMQMVTTLFFVIVILHVWLGGVGGP